MRAKLISIAEASGVILVVGGSFALSVAFGCVVFGVLLFAGARVADQ